MSKAAVTMNEIKSYTDCMVALKSRYAAICRTTAKPREQATIEDVQFVCLQFRMIVELIALASLCANKTEYANQHAKFASHWNAKRIFNDLEHINPRFYPAPMVQIRDPITGKPTGTSPMTGPYLTKDDAIRLYEDCSSMLHSRNPYAPQVDVTAIVKQFGVWAANIKSLLGHHQVQLINADEHLLVIMESLQGQVQVTLWEKVLAPPPPVPPVQ